MKGRLSKICSVHTYGVSQIHVFCEFLQLGKISSNWQGWLYCVFGAHKNVNIPTFGFPICVQLKISRRTTRLPYTLVELYKIQNIVPKVLQKANNFRQKACLLRSMILKLIQLGTGKVREKSNLSQLKGQFQLVKKRLEILLYIFIFDISCRHYLMGLGPNTKKIPQNSGKQIRIPEGMQFNSLVSKKSEKAGHWRKITKPLFPR